MKKFKNGDILVVKRRGDAPYLAHFENGKYDIGGFGGLGSDFEQNKKLYKLRKATSSDIIKILSEELRSDMLSDIDHEMRDLISSKIRDIYNIIYKIREEKTKGI
jgi:hypothetical protein